MEYATAASKQINCILDFFDENFGYRLWKHNIKDG